MPPQRYKLYYDDGLNGAYTEAWRRTAAVLPSTARSLLLQDAPRKQRQYSAPQQQSDLDRYLIPRGPMRGMEELSKSLRGLGELGGHLTAHLHGSHGLVTLPILPQGLVSPQWTSVDLCCGSNLPEVVSEVGDSDASPVLTAVAGARSQSYRPFLAWFHDSNPCLRSRASPEVV